MWLTESDNLKNLTCDRVRMTLDRVRMTSDTLVAQRVKRLLAMQET